MWGNSDHHRLLITKSICYICGAMYLSCHPNQIYVWLNKRNHIALQQLMWSIDPEGDFGYNVIIPVANGERVRMIWWSLQCILLQINE